MSSTCPHNTANFGPLAAEIDLVVWGTPIQISRSFASWQRYCMASSSGHQPNCGVEQRAPPMFGRATITLGIDRWRHSSLWSPYVIGRPYIFSSCLWSPYVIGQTIIFLPCSFFLPSSSSSFFSSPNLSGRRSDVCHTSTHGVALVRI